MSKINTGQKGKYQLYAIQKKLKNKDTDSLKYKDK